METAAILLRWLFAKALAECRFACSFCTRVLISYGQVGTTQTTLLKVQPGFKTDLLEGVERFFHDTAEFYRDYDTK